MSLSPIDRELRVIDNPDEIANIVKEIKSKTITYAPTEGIEAHSETAERFIELVLDLSWAFISDSSSLYDFDMLSIESMEDRIREVFGVDVSDIEDKNLVKIFERIDRAR